MGFWPGLVFKVEGMQGCRCIRFQVCRVLERGFRCQGFWACRVYRVQAYSF